MTEQDTNIFDVYIGSKLKNIRKKRGISQQELANKHNLSRQLVQKYENGDARIPSSTLYKFSQSLNVKTSKFFDDIDKIDHTDSLPEGEFIAKVRVSPLNVLLIEDDSGDELLFRKTLDKFNFNSNIHVITNGEEALTFLRNRTKVNTFPRPDVIFLDLNLPRISGLELLQQVKKDRDIQDIPVVALTNSIRKEEMIKAYRIGVAGYVTKPFTTADFIKKLLIILQYWSIVALPNM